MTDANNVDNVDKIYIGVVVLIYKFEICLYVNFGTLWVSGGGGGGCACQDIDP